MSGSGAYYFPSAYRTRLSGRGDYKKTFRKAVNWARTASKGYGKKIGTFLGSGAGRAIESRLGVKDPGIISEVGGKVGGLLGSGFSKLTGWGSYKIRRNSFIQPERNVPYFGSSSIRIKNREFIGTVDMSSFFAVSTYPINPGMRDTFPWLSAIAQNYEQYYVHGMVFQYLSTSSVAIANASDLALGQVIMTTDYDASDSEFNDASQMLNSFFTNSEKPSESFLHPVECAPGSQVNKLYFVRLGPPAPNTDIRLYDLGVMGIATDGPADYTRAGQLWVSYDISLHKPVNNYTLGYALPSIQFSANADFTNAASIFGQRIINGQATINGMDVRVFAPTTGLDLIIEWPTTINSGYYRWKVVYGGSAPAPAIVSPTYNYIDCQPLRWLGPANAPTNNETLDLPPAGDPGIAWMVEGIIKLTGYAATINLDFSGATMPILTIATASNFLVTVDQVNGLDFARSFIIDP